MSCVVTLHYNHVISHLTTQNLLQQHGYYDLKMSVNRASTTFGLVSWGILGLCGDIEQQTDYWLPFSARTVATTSKRCPRHELKRSINDFCPCIMENPRVVQQH